MIVHLNTSFLVDLLRETARQTKGPASAFLARHVDDELRASLFVACELLLGVELSAMDLLIAASAFVDGVPLATRNASHFARVPDLRLLEY